MSVWVRVREGEEEEEEVEEEGEEEKEGEEEEEGKTEVRSTTSKSSRWGDTHAHTHTNILNKFNINVRTT